MSACLDARRLKQSYCSAMFCVETDGVFAISFLFLRSFLWLKNFSVGLQKAFFCYASSIACQHVRKPVPVKMRSNQTRHIFTLSVKFISKSIPLSLPSSSLPSPCLKFDRNSVVWFNSTGDHQQCTSQQKHLFKIFDNFSSLLCFMISFFSVLPRLCF